MYVCMYVCMYRDLKSGNILLDVESDEIKIIVCLFVVYLFEQVEVLAAIKLMWTCYTHPYTHKGQPQQRELHALLFSISVRVL